MKGPARSRAQPRRSAGCGTCRRRKVKCDQARPVCERCRNGSYTCLGYDSPRTFVHFDRTSLEAASSFNSAREAGDLKNVSHQAVNQLANPNAEYPIFPAVPLLAFADEIVLAHLMSQMSMDETQIPPNRTDMPLEKGAAHAPGRTAAYTSALSVAKALFGRMHKMPEMVEDAAQLYGLTMSNFQRDLQHKNAGSTQALLNLWCGLFLGVYEMVSTTAPVDWLHHSRGVAVLTEMAGPEAFQAPAALRMLVANRAFIFIGAIVARKRSFLEKRSWKMVPWALTTEPKPLIVRLHDIYCDIPGFFEDADTISARRAVDGIDKDLLQLRLGSSLEQLCQVRRQWDEQNPGACWERAPTAATSLSLDNLGMPLFDTILVFRDTDLAIEALQFAVIVLLLRSAARTACIAFPPLDLTCLSGATPSSSNTLLMPGWGTREQEALETCRIVDYLLLGEDKARGAFALLFPLRVACGNLADKPDMVRWIKGILDQISHTRGFQIGEHVLNLSPERMIGADLARG